MTVPNDPEYSLVSAIDGSTTVEFGSPAAAKLTFDKLVEVVTTIKQRELDRQIQQSNDLARFTQSVPTELHDHPSFILLVTSITEGMPLHPADYEWHAGALTSAIENLARLAEPPRPAKRPRVRIEGGARICLHCNRVLTFNFMRDDGGDCTCAGARAEVAS